AMRPERASRCALARGVVSRAPQTPERRRAPLPLPHPPPWRSHLSRRHTPQRAQRRAHLAGYTPLRPHETARPLLIDGAQTGPRPGVALGQPAVTRLPRLADAPAP